MKKARDSAAVVHSLPAPSSDRPEAPLESFARRHARVIGWILLIGSFVLFMGTRSAYNGGDTRAISDLSWWTSQIKKPRLNGHPGYPGDQNVFGYWAVRTADGTVATKYHHGGVLPFSVPVLLAIQAGGFPIPANRMLVYSKLLAALMMAIATWCLWRAICSSGSNAAGVLAAVHFAAASPILGALSQGLWVQTSGLFCQAVSLAILARLLAARSTEGEGRRLLRWSLLFVGGGFACWAAICRPTFAIWTMGVALFALYSLRKHAWPVIVGMAVAGLTGLALLKYSTGSWFGIWGEGKVGEVGHFHSVTYILQGLAGFWISPGRGLLVFSPWLLLLLPLALYLRFRQRRRLDGWELCHVVFALVIFLAVSSFSSWPGGWSGGPRLQADLLISLLVLCAPALAYVANLPKLLAVLFLLGAPAVWTNWAWATRHWDHSWENFTGNIDRDVWRIRNGQLHWYWSEGAIERKLRGEKREPILSSPTIDPRNPEVGRYLESGITARPGDGHFQILGRRAGVLFQLPPSITGAPSHLEFQIADRAMWGVLRQVDVYLNGTRLKRVQFVSGGDFCQFRLDIPDGAYRPGAVNTIVFRDRNPIFMAFAPSYACIRALRILVEGR